MSIDNDTARPVADLDMAPLWATSHEQVGDDTICYARTAAAVPLDDETGDPMPVRMWVYASSHARADSAALISQDEPTIYVGVPGEVAYGFAPQQARVLAAALIELADAAERQETDGFEPRDDIESLARSLNLLDDRTVRSS